MRHIYSPYRVCPLGAHVDHQHGLVTGFAIDKGVDLWYDIASDSSVELQSAQYDNTIRFNIAEPTLVRQKDWGDYTRGAKYALQKRFVLKRGIRGRIQGSLPIGGLSSSAAVLVAYVMAFADANEIRLAPMEVILIASEAEREYIGLTNGILDQACIVLGKKDHLLMLDCDVNEYRLIPRAASMPPMKIGIFFSGLTRSLINSNYNLRVHECRTAAWILQAYDNVPLKTPDKTFLRDVSRDALAKYQDKMPERFVKRATHFYSEYRRVREGITAWEKGDLNWFGRLSFESCESSIHNYECGSPELVAIYNAMRQTDGIYGGRFSGAGFKGACIALCDPSKIEAIEQSVREKYLAEFPQYKDAMECYFCDVADGARIMED